MAEERRYALQTMLQEVVSSEDANARNEEALLQKHIVELADRNTILPSETVKQINIALNEEGDVTVATSLKIPNVKFHLGEFLLEVTSAALTVSSSLSTPIKLVVPALRFLQKVRQLATVTISAEDAKVLIAIYKLHQEGEVPTVDKVQELLSDVQEGQLARSLETLENLACITVTMNEVLLNESIVIRRVA